MNKTEIKKEILKYFMIFGTLCTIGFVFFQVGHHLGKIDMCQEDLGMRYLTNEKCVTMTEYENLLNKQKQLVESFDVQSKLTYDERKALQDEYDTLVKNVGE